MQKLTRISDIKRRRCECLHTFSRQIEIIRQYFLGFFCVYDWCLCALIKSSKRQLRKTIFVRNQFVLTGFVNSWL